MATFEKYFTSYLAEKMGRAMATVITDEQISVSIDDRQELSSFHAEAIFIITCSFASKKTSDELFEATWAAVRTLPRERPLVMSASLLAQDVQPAKAPRKWEYTGSFQVRYHLEDSY